MLLMLCGAPTFAQEEVDIPPDLELLEFLGSFESLEDEEEWLELLENAEKRVEEELRRGKQEREPDED